MCAEYALIQFTQMFPNDDNIYWVIRTQCHQMPKIIPSQILIVPETAAPIYNIKGSRTGHSVKVSL